MLPILPVLPLTTPFTSTRHLLLSPVVCMRLMPPVYHPHDTAGVTTHSASPAPDRSNQQVPAGIFEKNQSGKSFPLHGLKP